MIHTDKDIRDLEIQIENNFQQAPEWNESCGDFFKEIDALMPIAHKMLLNVPVRPSKIMGLMQLEDSVYVGSEELVRITMRVFKGLISVHTQPIYYDNNVAVVVAYLLFATEKGIIKRSPKISSVNVANGQVNALLHAETAAIKASLASIGLSVEQATAIKEMEEALDPKKVNNADEKPARALPRKKVIIDKSKDVEKEKTISENTEKKVDGESHIIVGEKQDVPKKLPKKKVNNNLDEVVSWPDKSSLDYDDQLIDGIKKAKSGKAAKLSMQSFITIAIGKKEYQENYGNSVRRINTLLLKHKEQMYDYYVIQSDEL